MSKKDGILVVSLKYKWFDMIASGEKLEEYRGENWTGRFLTAKGWEILKTGRPEEELDWLDNRPYGMKSDHFFYYHTLRAQRGYSGIWLEKKIRRIRWGKPRPEWSGETVKDECFVIEIE